MNPKDYKSWKFSSLPYYLDDWNAEWVRPTKIQQLFSLTDEYHEFLEDYEGQKETLSELSTNSLTSVKARCHTPHGLCAILQGLTL